MDQRIGPREGDDTTPPDTEQHQHFPSGADIAWVFGLAGGVGLALAVIAEALLVRRLPELACIGIGTAVLLATAWVVASLAISWRTRRATKAPGGES